MIFGDKRMRMQNIQISLSYQVIVSYMWHFLKTITFSNSQIITIIIIKLGELKIGLSYYHYHYQYQMTIADNIYYILQQQFIKSFITLILKSLYIKLFYHLQAKEKVVNVVGWYIMIISKYSLRLGLGLGLA